MAWAVSHIQRVILLYNRLVLAETGRLLLYRNHNQKCENKNHNNCYVFHNFLTPPLIKGAETAATVSPRELYHTLSENEIFFYRNLSRTLLPGSEYCTNMQGKMYLMIQQKNFGITAMNSKKISSPKRLSQTGAAFYDWF